MKKYPKPTLLMTVAKNILFGRKEVKGETQQEIPYQEKHETPQEIIERLRKIKKRQVQTK